MKLYSIVGGSSERDHTFQHVECHVADQTRQGIANKTWL